MADHLLRILSGNSHPELAEEVAKRIGTELETRTLDRFPSGEVRSKLERSVRGSDVFVIQTCTEDVDRDFMELFIMIDTLKRSAAAKVHAVIPYFGYARSDSMSIYDKRAPLTASLMAQLLEAAGTDHVMTFNLHSSEVQGVFRKTVDNLRAERLLREDLASKRLQNAVLVAPRAGAAKFIEKIAGQMDLPMAIVHKMPSTNGMSVASVMGDVQDKTCVIFDDLAVTADTAVDAKDALMKKGANPDAYLYVVHPILAGTASERLRAAAFKEIVVTNTVPIPARKNIPGLRQISVAGLLADVIKEAHYDEGSLTKYY